MHHAIENIRKGRMFAIGVLDKFTAEQLNKIPDGFSNNIIWNIGHMIAAHEGICYKRNSLEAHMTEEFWLSYKPGSKPEKEASADEIAFIKNDLLASLDRLQADYNAKKFETVVPWTTRYGI